MDSERFERLTRSSLSTLHTRRRLASAWSIGALAIPGRVDAKKKHKHRHRKKVKRNAFGCVDVSTFCQRDDQCCSGICKGKKGLATCQAHDDGGCQAGQVACLDIDVRSTTASGDEGVCTRSLPCLAAATPPT